MRFVSVKDEGYSHIRSTIRLGQNKIQVLKNDKIVNILLKNNYGRIKKLLFPYPYKGSVPINGYIVKIIFFCKRLQRKY